MVPVRASIEQFGPAKVASASGFPIPTICRWRDEDRIPGTGTAQQLKRQQFEAAVAKLRAEMPKKRKAA